MSGFIVTNTGQDIFVRKADPLKDCYLIHHPYEPVSEGRGRESLALPKVADVVAYCRGKGAAMVTLVIGHRDKTLYLAAFAERFREEELTAAV